MFQRDRVIQQILESVSETGRRHSSGLILYSYLSLEAAFPRPGPDGRPVVLGQLPPGWLLVGRELPLPFDIASSFNSWGKVLNFEEWTLLLG